jgi:hypothetical protein
VFRIVVEIVQKHFKHRVRTLSEREQRIVLTNFGGGVSEARGKSADRPATLLGEGLEWMIVDEAAQFHREAWDQHLSQRLVDRNGWALMVSTPRGPGWFYRMFRRGQRKIDAAYESWSMPSTANPHLDATAIEAERARLPADIFRQEYEGAFINVASEPCEMCKGPRHGALGVIFLQGETEPTRCPECEGVVDKNGDSVVGLSPDGSPRLTIIREFGTDWPLGCPEVLISFETRKKDEAAQLGPSTKPIWHLTPEEEALAKAGVPVKDWPESKPTPRPIPPRFVPGPIGGWSNLDE